MKTNIQTVITISSLLTVLLAACSPTLALSSTAPTSPVAAGQIEPNAGKWKTWVLKTGNELRPAAPPNKEATDKENAELRALADKRDAKALTQIAYWDAGSPSYRWQEIALGQVVKASSNPPRTMRMMALMNVAIYDAMIAAWDAKYAYNRPRPSQTDAKFTPLVAVPNSPAYPAEHAVAAGAAAAVLSYIYPDDTKTFEELAQQAGQSRVLAGVQYPSDVVAGLVLGHAVAAKVIERAKADGSDAKWSGTIPKGPGYWNGENPLEPLAGTWKPWVLKSGNQFRPPAPPAYDSAQKLAELAEIKTFTRTFATSARAMFYQLPDGVYSLWYNNGSQRIFEHHLDQNAPRAARAYALMSVAHADAIIACYDAKYAYWAIRPFQLDKAVTTLFPTPNHPSYPAAHGCVSGAIARALEYLFPDEAKFIHDKADEAGLSRMWAGVHYRSDIEAGLKLGRQVADLIIERAKQDIEYKQGGSSIPKR